MNEDRVRESTQEDIVVFDRSLVPAVLAHSSAAEGVFPVDGVLARVEVKSTLTRGELRKAVLAAKAIYEMHFCWDGHGKPPTFPRSAVFAFSSDLEKTGGPAKEIERLLSVVDECGLYFKSPCDRIPGPISALCVVGRGFWGYGKRKGEQNSRWIQATITEPHDEILNFVGWMSNSCFDVHADHMSGAGGGIGNFILSNDICEDSPVQEPPKASV